MFVDVWLQKDCKHYAWHILLSVFRVLCIVAGFTSFVIVSRSASVLILMFLLSLVSSLSVLPHSLFMPDRLHKGSGSSASFCPRLCDHTLCIVRALVPPSAVSQPHVFHRKETGSCHWLAHAAEGGELDPDTGDNFAPVNASSNFISTRVSRKARRQEPTFVSAHFEPDTSTRRFNHTYKFHRDKNMD